MTVRVFAVRTAAAFLPPGGATGPRTVSMTLMRLAAVSGGDQAQLCFEPHMCFTVISAVTKGLCL